MTARDLAADERDDEIDLIDLWRTLWERKALVLSGMFLGTAVGLALALIEPQVFRAETVVTEVHDTNLGGSSGLASQFGGLAPLAGVNLGAANDMSREAQAVLSSRRLVEEFIQRNDLLLVLARGSSKSPTLWRAVARFQKDVVSIRQETRTGLTTVSVRWTDPSTAAKWANGFVGLANEIMRARALDEATRNVSYLKEQIAKTNVVELQRVMYNLIENETKTLMLANARREYAFRVVDPAVAPEVRFSPRRSVMVLVGLALGFCAGVVAALLRAMYLRTKQVPAVQP